VSGIGYCRAVIACRRPLIALPPEFHELAARVRNWGRWGDDDRLGTLNLITDASVVAAASLVQTGRRLSLAYPLRRDGIQIGAIAGRINPVHTMVSVNEANLGDPDGFCSSDDVVEMALQAATHWDGLGHVSYGGTLYNGVPADTVSSDGSAVLGIEQVRTLTGRGVLLDVARVRGVERLGGGEVVSAADLDAAARQAGVTIESGDIVLIRTGWIQLLHDGDREAYSGFTEGSPGPGLEAVEWFRRHDIAAVATDTYIFEVFPSENPEAMLAIHLLDLVDMGLTQGQNWDLEELAADCASDGRYAFLLEASPQPVEGAVGSPVNPVAVK
jgi:kynurenine formamidase